MTQFKKMTASRFSLLFTMLAVALIYFVVTRFALLAFSSAETDAGIEQMLTLNLIGLIYDFAFFIYAALPFVLYFMLLPKKWWGGRVNTIITHSLAFITLYGMGFVAIAEWLFWNEFNVRFNFISVDYLVYRREVTNNIAESYPLFTLLMLTLFITIVIYHFFLRNQINKALAQTESILVRASIGCAWFLVALLFLFGLNQGLRTFSDNNYVNELASNGPYQFFAAFRNNEMDYTAFYQTLPDKQASALLKVNVLEKNTEITKSGTLYSISRRVSSEAAEKPLNIVLIMVESLSAKYLGSFGNDKNLTPYLDKLADESIFFDKFYATGTRTTRGLEAVTLSIPPTPGRSIIKRIGREIGFWSLGNVLKKKGYDTQFIYGGHGYFDNMNDFFAGNGYGIIDQTDIEKGPVTFKNAWGVSDEDLLNTVLNTANKSAKDKKPFFFHIMTTSNHRPYSYPDGRIDIPSASGREGAVKYTDWAIGDFIEKAKSKRWFKNTIFVIVADHCAGSAGKRALPINKYHIPLFIYAPSQFSPKRVSTIASQMDIAPTLLGLMNMDYGSYAFGKDIMKMKAEDGRALIGNYQSLGLYQHGQLSILSPKKRMQMQLNPESGAPIVSELAEPNEQMKLNIAYYQGASHIYHNRMNAWAGVEAKNGG